MTRFLLKRLGLALITLFLLSVIVFGISILPGNVGRAVLGPFATQESSTRSTSNWGRTIRLHPVRRLGGRLLQGDLGMSLTKQVPPGTC